MAQARPLIVEAIKKHSATVIMAHGLGDSGMGWISLAQTWRRRGKFEDVKFVFPNAPDIPITVNMGLKMPGWYDIVEFNDIGRSQDKPGILKSRDYLVGLIADEVNAGTPSEKIVLGGFSQGGAMSLFTGVTTSHKLAGIFGLSSYLLLHSEIKDYIKESNDANKETPIFMGHGDADQVVRYVWGQQTAEVLQKELGYKVEFKTYKGLPHSADPDEIDDLEIFINKCLRNEPSSAPTL